MFRCFGWRPALSLFFLSSSCAWTRHRIAFQSLRTCDSFYSTKCHAVQKSLWSIEECLAQQDSIQFIDASWYHKGDRNGRSEFEAGPRIPGAHYWDMDDMATSKELFPQQNPKGLRVMFPPKSLIAAALNAMNISVTASTMNGRAETETKESTPSTVLMIYGREGCWFTPRTWYILKSYVDSLESTVSVGLMQGSLEDWEAAGGPLDTSPMPDGYPIRAKDLVTDDMITGLSNEDEQLDRLVDMDQVLEELKNPNNFFVDTRGLENFSKGHLPGAKHIPYRSLVESSNSLQVLPRKELQARLDAIDVPKDRPIWLSCGSGVSVCHVALALEECGYPRPYIYDGSWNEWGSDPDTPKEVSHS